MCLDPTGPKERAALSAVQWMCSVSGTPHDRDMIAAIKTLVTGVVMTLEKTI